MVIACLPIFHIKFLMKNKCDWIYKNHPYWHILYFEKYHFEATVVLLCYIVAMPDLLYSSAVLYVVSVSLLTLPCSIHCWFLRG